MKNEDDTLREGEPEDEMPIVFRDVEEKDSVA